jgi:CxxC-x17-CxxC domain-containing protein
MGNFNRGGDRGGNRGGGGRFFGRDGFGRKSFDRGNDRSGSRGGDRGGFGGPREGNREMYKTICSNCGKECEVPFKPTNSKPVYCNECFPKFGGRDRDNRSNDRPRFSDRRPSSSMGGDQFKGQLESLNVKLDKILRLLEPTKPVSETSAPVVSAVPMDNNLKEVEVMKASDITEAPKVKKSPKKVSTKSKAK